MADPHGGSIPAPKTAKPSPVRLVVLLGILAVLAGALAYDQFVAKPAVAQANDRLADEVDKLNSMGFDLNLTPEEKAKLRDERFVNPTKVQAILKRKPTWTEIHDDHAVEYYCWWGRLPWINRRHFLSVVYFGKEPKLRYNTHHQNTNPPAESLPGYQNIGDASVPEGVAVIGAGEPAEAVGGLPGGPPDPGKAIRKGKGKRGGGLPPPGESFDEPSAAPEPAAPGEAKSDAAASDAPKSKGEEIPANDDTSQPGRKGDATEESKADR